MDTTVVTQLCRTHLKRLLCTWQLHSLQCLQCIVSSLLAAVAQQGTSQGLPAVSVSQHTACCDFPVLWQQQRQRRRRWWQQQMQ
jgi:hypothetical protein